MLNSCINSIIFYFYLFILIFTRIFLLNSCFQAEKEIPTQWLRLPGSSRTRHLAFQSWFSFSRILTKIERLVVVNNAILQLLYSKTNKWNIMRFFPVVFPKFSVFLVYLGIHAQKLLLLLQQFLHPFRIMFFLPRSGKIFCNLQLEIYDFKYCRNAIMILINSRISQIMMIYFLIITYILHSL